MMPTAAADRPPTEPELPRGPIPFVSPRQHSEDRALVGRMLDGDGAAFEVFGERYSRALWRFALHRLEGDRERASEVAQTAMTKALAKLETYRGEASLLTWLCACCRNEILMYFRSRGRRPEELELAEGLEPAAGSVVERPADAEAQLLGRERALRVHLVLDALPGDYARALEWKYVDRLAVREIARRLERTEKSTESLLTRARAAFRRQWEAWSASAGPTRREEP